MKRTSSAWKRMSTRRIAKRSGFTLVELLVVITIIGILVGLTLAGVNAARLSILRGAAKYEMTQFDNAFEAYKNKYGDYPPDGSSWPIMEAHLRKAFPNILSSELNLLNPTNAVAPAGAFYYLHNDSVPGRVFDPAEAVVFFLGGFSSDSQRPFTGPGGPFIVSGTTYAYNVSRDNAFFEFKSNRLTVVQNAGGIGAISTDETLYNEGVPNDMMPAYIGYGPSMEAGGVPVVYFDSRTYNIGAAVNFYSIQGDVNCARPYLSDDPNTAAPEFAGAPASQHRRPKLWANTKRFQVLSAGYDNLYGSRNVATTSSAGAVLFATPSGGACELLTNPATSLTQFYRSSDMVSVKYFLTDFGGSNPALDNVSNFVDGNTFGESR